MHAHYGLIHAASTLSSSQINPSVDLSCQSQQFENAATKDFLVLEKTLLSIMKMA